MTTGTFSLLKAIIVICLLFFLFRLLFPSKPVKKFSSKPLVYNIRLRFFFLSLITLLLLIAFLYYYGLDFIMILQRILLHASKMPLLIEVKNAYAFITLIFLFIVSNYFLVAIPLKKYLGRNYGSVLAEQSSKIGFDISAILKITNVIFGILWIITFCLFVWSFDYYIVANENGIYYNPIENFGHITYYHWSEVDKIFYITFTENNGTTYKQTDPYYQIQMKDNQLLELAGDNTEANQWVSIIKNKSGAPVYEKRGEKLILIV